MDWSRSVPDAGPRAFRHQRDAVAPALLHRPTDMAVEHAAEDSFRISWESLCRVGIVYNHKPSQIAGERVAERVPDRRRTGIDRRIVANFRGIADLFHCDAASARGRRKETTSLHVRRLAPA